MRRLLELTGRQGTLDEFRVARAKYGEARTLHREARQHFEQKKLGLAQLQSKLRQYREWEALGEKLHAIDGFLLPAARHFAAAEELEAATGNFSPKQEEVATLKTAAAEDREAADARKAEIPDLEREHEELGGQEKRLSAAAREAAVQLGKARRASQAGMARVRRRLGCRRQGLPGRGHGGGRVGRDSPVGMPACPSRG